MCALPQQVKRGQLSKIVTTNSGDDDGGEESEDATYTAREDQKRAKSQALPSVGQETKEASQEEAYEEEEVLSSKRTSAAASPQVRGSSPSQANVTVSSATFPLISPGARSADSRAIRLVSAAVARQSVSVDHLHSRPTSAHSPPAPLTSHSHDAVTMPRTSATMKSTFVAPSSAASLSIVSHLPVSPYLSSPDHSAAFDAVRRQQRQTHSRLDQRTPIATNALIAAWLERADKLLDDESTSCHNEGGVPGHRDTNDERECLASPQGARSYRKDEEEDERLVDEDEEEEIRTEEEAISNSSMLLERVLQQIRAQSSLTGEWYASSSQRTTATMATSIVPPWPVQVFVSDTPQIVESPTEVEEIEESKRSSRSIDADGTEQESHDDTPQSVSISHGGDTNDESEVPIEWAHVRSVTSLLSQLNSSSTTRSSGDAQSQSCPSEDTLRVRDVGDVDDRNRSNSSSSAKITEVDSHEARQFLAQGPRAYAVQSKRLAEDDEEEEAPPPCSESSSASSSDAESSAIDVDGDEGRGYAEDEESLEPSTRGQDDGERSAREGGRGVRAEEQGCPTRHTSAAKETTESNPSRRRSQIYGRSSSRLLRAASALSSSTALARSLRGSVCSTFWSPSARASMQRRSNVQGDVPRVIVVARNDGSAMTPALRKSKVSSRSDVKSEDDSSSSASSASRKRRSCAAQRRTSTPYVTRRYTKPNVRITIYPRRPDEFWRDRRMRQEIQARLRATITGQASANIITTAASGQAAVIRRKRNLSFSSGANTVKSPPPPPPTGPLPDIPRPKSVRLSLAYSWCSTCEDIVLCESYDDSESSQASADGQRKRVSLTLNRAEQTIKRTSVQRDPLRDSWTTVTESWTSYCSWISLTENSSISSTSTHPAEMVRQQRRVQRELEQLGSVNSGDQVDRPQPIVFQSPVAMEMQESLTGRNLAVPVSLQAPMSPDPPSSCILPTRLMPTAPPLGWTRERYSREIRRTSCRLPMILPLSPFFIDVNAYWPKEGDDGESIESALTKWARHQRNRATASARGAPTDVATRLLHPQTTDEPIATKPTNAGSSAQLCQSYLSRGGPAWEGRDATACCSDSSCTFSIDSTNECDACRKETQTKQAAVSTVYDDELPLSSSSSSDSSSVSSVLTPPRSEYIRHGLESPGKRLSQCLTPCRPSAPPIWQNDGIANISDSPMTLEQEGHDTKTHLSTTALHEVPPLALLSSIRPGKGSNQSNGPNINRSYVPPHRRWILVDAEGKRITGGQHRNSSSTWRSGTYSSDSNRSGGGSGDTAGSESYTVSQSISESESGSSLDSLSSSVISDSSGTVSAEGSSISTSGTRKPSIAGQRESPQEARDRASALPKKRSYEEAELPTRRRSEAEQDVFLVDGPIHRPRLRSILQNRSTTTSGSPRDDDRLSSTTRSMSLSSGTNGSAASLSIRFASDEEPKQELSRSKPKSAPAAGWVHTDPSSTSLSSLSLPPPANRDGDASERRIHPSDSGYRLTRADLAQRIQREEARKKRNDERLETLDKLEGRSRRSNLLSNLLKSNSASSNSTSGGQAGGMDAATKTAKPLLAAPIDAMSTGENARDLLEHDQRRRLKKTGQASASDAAQIYLYDDEDAEMPTTPLTPTRAALRQMELDWERNHHVQQFQPMRAQKFTNVTGFDIGIVPYRQQLQQRQQQQVRRAKSAVARKVRPNDGQDGQRRQPQTRTLHRSHTGTVSSVSGMSDEGDRASSLAAEPLPAYQRSDASLSRDLQAGLRKLSVVVEARQTAKERCVDK